MQKKKIILTIKYYTVPDVLGIGGQTSSTQVVPL